MPSTKPASTSSVSPSWRVRTRSRSTVTQRRNCFDDRDHLDPAAPTSTPRATPSSTSLRAGWCRVSASRTSRSAGSARCSIVRDIDRVADGGSTSASSSATTARARPSSFAWPLHRAQARTGRRHADLSPDRRLQATGGQARDPLRRAHAQHGDPHQAGRRRPGQRRERFIGAAQAAAKAHPRQNPVIAGGSSRFRVVSGYDFATVIERYWRAHDEGNDELKVDALRWLRGEFTPKTEARHALGCAPSSTTPPSTTTLKLLARFVRLAGYSAGSWSCLDEMVNLYKLANRRPATPTTSRSCGIVNDALQGTVEGPGLLFRRRRPRLLMDTRRGLYCYDALRSRLAENTFAAAGWSTCPGPSSGSEPRPGRPLRAARQAPPRLRHRRTGALPAPDEALTPSWTTATTGRRRLLPDAAHHHQGVPDLLAILEQNPELNWREPLGAVDLAEEADPDLEPLPEDVSSAGVVPLQPPGPDDDDLSTFRLN